MAETKRAKYRRVKKQIALDVASFRLRGKRPPETQKFSPWHDPLHLEVLTAFSVAARNLFHASQSAIDSALANYVRVLPWHELANVNAIASRVAQVEDENAQAAAHELRVTQDQIRGSFRADRADQARSAAEFVSQPPSRHVRKIARKVGRVGKPKRKKA